MTRAERLYVYRDDRGWLKVGQTSTGNVGKRVRAQSTGAGATNHVLLLDVSRQYADGNGCFSDHDIHRRLEKAGAVRFIKDNGRKSEWFNTDLTTIEAAIEAERQRQPMATRYTRNQTFGMRDEQRAAVAKTREQFTQTRLAGAVGHMLWNAKMRFGKTLATYHLAKQEGFQRVLVATFIPSAGRGWENDLESHVDFDGFRFARLSDPDLAEAMNHAGPLVVFGSLQDLMGKSMDQTGTKAEIKSKNQSIHNTLWDLVVLDEYHYGAWREGSKDLFGAECLDDATIGFDEKNLPIRSKNFLYLSGTAFRAIDSGEFLDDQIFQWTYPDEQNAKEQWTKDHPDRPHHENPYAGLPQMHMATFRLDDALTQVAPDEEGGFDLNAFFEATFDKNGQAHFTHEKEVNDWLRQITGRRAETRALGGDKAVWPFASGAQAVFGDLRHTFWYLPSVAACEAMARLLKNDAHFGRDYTPVVAAGEQAGSGEAALVPVWKAIGDNPHASRTITLSCGKLTTGVTIPEWTAVFMLRNMSAPETFFQTAFRAQSPWIGTAVKDGQQIPIIRKKHVFVFDFAPQRALRLLADYATRSSVSRGGAGNPEKAADDMLHVWPVIAWDGTRMAEVSARDLLDVATTGTSARGLAKKWESALLVNLDSQVLQRVLDNEHLLGAINAIQGHRRLNQARNELTFLINAQDQVAELKRKKAIKEQEGGALSKKETQNLSATEKELRKRKDEIREKLIKFSTRLPLFMYLSEHREMALNDVIRNVEPALFQEVTGLTVQQFDNLVEIGLFNREMMNSAVYHFKRYEDGSLDYIQLPGRAQVLSSEPMGLFSTTMDRKDAQVAYGE